MHDGALTGIHSRVLVVPLSLPVRFALPLHSLFGLALCWWRTATIAGLFACAHLAQAHEIGGPAEGLLEAGTPPFVVLGKEALGLTTPPTDFHLMPDGRLLVFASQHLALGDGVRWEVFAQAPTDLRTTGFSGRVDTSGRIYIGIDNGVAEIEIGGDGYWNLVRAATWPSGPRSGPPRSAVEAGGRWFWHSGSGAIFAWQPGATPQLVAQADNTETIFEFRNQIYISDQTDGRLNRVSDEGLEPIFAAGTALTSETITCTLGLSSDLLLAGTHARGLKTFDGTRLQPFTTAGPLAGTARINDLCATAGGNFAAAVENLGLVFFDKEGRTLQVLERTVDHRLSRIKRLVPAPGGVIWGLLDDGILRVEFPSRVSHYEPLIGSGIITAQPNRLDGKLWIAADGQTLRGVYNEDGRLARLEVDSPPGAYVFTLSCDLGLPVVGSEHGAWYRDASGWVSFAPGVDNLRVLSPRRINGRWLYGAHEEAGWLQRTPTGIAIERIPLPELSNVYNAEMDRDGIVWMEMGSGRIGRLIVEDQALRVETFSSEHGIPTSWTQLFVIDGIARFNVAGEILRFDEQRGRFVRDEEFLQTLPPLAELGGRPGLDAQGRLWLTASGMPHIFTRDGERWLPLPEPMPAGYRPYYYTFEDGGVVWMHSERRLARYDPHRPLAPATPLRALITHVTVAATNERVFPKRGALPPLDYAENSVIVHFVAPGTTFSVPVSFEVKLQGAETRWSPAGRAGSALFNRLKEGDYVLHVRPRAGDMIGEESSLAFTIRPPWFRTGPAYLVYGLSGIGLVLGAGWLSSLLERREKFRLEQLVKQRTRELNASNERLANQVEEIRALSQAIAQSPVAVFITSPEGVVEFANPKACQLTGYSANELVGRNARELRATSELDSADPLAEAAARSEPQHGQAVNRHRSGRLLHVRTTVAPIRSEANVIKHWLILEEDITETLAEQERRRRLEAQLIQAQKLESVGTLAGGIAHDFNNILTGMLGYTELARLATEDGEDSSPHLAEINTLALRARDLVAQILTFSRQGRARLLPVDLAECVAEALKLIRATTPSTVEIRTQLESGRTLGDITQIQQVVLNLCTNAIHAMRDRKGRLEVSVQRVVVDADAAASVANLHLGAYVRIRVADTGHGMDQSTLDRMFDPFFTTKAPGEGTGLGLAIVQGIVAGHGGALSVRSAIGQGTTFEIYFPATTETPAEPVGAPPLAAGTRQPILIVDDETTVATFVAARLGKLGYQPTVFNDPQAALEAFRAKPTYFAAVVTDLTMPKLTGADLMFHIRAAGSSIPAVIITGYGRDAVRAKLNELSGCLVLAKPFSGEELGRALEQVLSERSPFS